METKSLYPILVVEDLEATKAFYCNILNFRVKHDLVRKDGGRVFVLCNDRDLEIEVMEMPKAGPMHFEPGLQGFRMNVDDIEKARDELAAQGYTPVGEIFETAVSKNMFIKDNNGISITLMQHIKE